MPLHFSWKNAGHDLRVADRFQTGVSIHSHTMHSKENMAFLPKHAHQIPIVSGIIRGHEETFRRTNGRDLDYNRAWWTPPLPAADALRLEARQIEEKLGLRSLVSLTHPDSIHAGKQLA